MINAYREAVCASAEPLQREIDALLRTMGMSAPDLSPTANSISISELFRWLRGCVSMATSGNRVIGDLSAAVAVRSLSCCDKGPTPINARCHFRVAFTR